VSVALAIVVGLEGMGRDVVVAIGGVVFFLDFFYALVSPTVAVLVGGCWFGVDPVVKEQLIHI
jgi:hypothetical protein